MLLKIKKYETFENLSNCVMKYFNFSYNVYYWFYSVI